MSDEDDPFEQFDDADDRAGDPFDRLREGEPAADEQEDAETTDPVSDIDADPTSGLVDEDAPAEVDDRPTDGQRQPTDDERGDADRSGGDGSGATGADPEGVDATGGAATDADVGGEFEEMGQFIGTDREGDPFESADSVFQRQDIDGVDADEVWERITEARQHSVDSEEVSDEVVVDKHSFCEGCEHFSPPPEVRCNHEGTTILEFPDMESVKVHNCPVVARQQELEQMGE